MRRRRNQVGNMLTVVALTTGMTVAVGVAGFSFNSFLFQCDQMQSKTDALALQLAGKINEGGRVGQINELQQCSRELMFVSRQELKQCEQEDFSFLTPLSQQLMGEARAGHNLVERERQNQIRLIKSDLQAEALKHNSDRSDRISLALPLLQTREPQITGIDVGYIDNVESNVKNLNVIKELSDFDRQNGYIDSTTKLYRANIDARLPDQEHDLSFRISSLPAYVEKICAPARNTNPDVFLRTGTIFTAAGDKDEEIDQLPSAIQVFVSMNASFGPREKYQATVSLVSTGAANGAIAGSN